MEELSMGEVAPEATQAVSRLRLDPLRALGARERECPVAVVIPCYRVTRHIMGVIAAVPPWVAFILCVDDCCPDGSGEFILRCCTDKRVRVFRNEMNLGVGGATLRGYREAMRLGAEIVAKIDGDGQMNPHLLCHFVQPIRAGIADYTKGNRFYRPESLSGMPRIRLFGNAMLSFFTKLSSGYWNITDPTNGYTAVHASVLRILPLDKIDQRYFFESDLLFRLGTVRAVVLDIPMDARYEEEVSNLSIGRIILPFLRGHSTNFFKRFVYSYLARDFNLASLFALLGLFMLVCGLAFGLTEWSASILYNRPATAGTVMLAALPTIIGLQLLLSAAGQDFANVPRHAIYPSLSRSDDETW